MTSRHNFPDNAIYETICCTRTKFYTFSKEQGRVAIGTGSILIQIETSKQQSKNKYFLGGKEINTWGQGRKHQCRGQGIKDIFVQP
jgi:hypothetical protein